MHLQSRIHHDPAKALDGLRETFVFFVVFVVQFLRIEFAVGAKICSYFVLVVNASLSTQLITNPASSKACA
jgi:hypothetical protein